MKSQPMSGVFITIGNNLMRVVNRIGQNSRGDKECQLMG